MQNLLEKIKQFPTEPGIYLFYDKNKELIYVGKATSLRNRVQSYFRGARSMRPIEQMMHEVMDIKIKQTDSVLEAVILEANYIKKFLPKYNVDGKDDKSWNYIVITKDDFPRVVTIRQHEFAAKRNEERGMGNEYLYIFGPYPGLKTREMMKLLNRLFFISTCKPPQQIKQGKQNKQSRPCLYRQIGQCLGVCTGEISSREYKSKVIFPLVTFLRGGKKKLVKSLEIKMNREARKENFEEAGRLRNQISTLQRIQDIALLNDSFFVERGMRNEEWGTRNPEKLRIGTSVERGIPKSFASGQVGNEESFSVNRIEGYDISNLGSTGKVGSMVVFNNKEAVKSEYRKFKIKTVVGQSDVDSLKEVLERRLAHSDIQITNNTDVQIKNKKDFWPLPDVFLIDGGKPQVNAAMAILKKHKLNIPLVGIAKGPERKRNDFIFGVKTREFIKFVNENQDLLIRVRDEAHRFAITFQRSLRKLKY